MLKTTTKIILTSLMAILLTSCQTTTPSHCFEIDWFEVGRSQGSQGKKLADPETKVSNCPLESSKTLSQLYENGYKAGLAYYCEPENAFELGRSNQDYKVNLCPKELETAFVSAYKKGQQALTLEKSSQTLRQQIDDALYTLRSRPLNDKDRETLQLDLSRLKEQNKTLKDKINGYAKEFTTPNNESTQSN